jgi:hypothetical protein
VLALAWAGRRMFEPGVGILAAVVLVFHHSLWYGGLTSALRPQPEVVS